MAFTLKQLQYFVAVAELGTVSGAAHALSVSQSSVTEALKDLEVDLGTTLFERHARGLNLSREGHRFLRHATGILAAVSQARLQGTDRDADLAGQLQIGVTPVVAGYVFSDLLARFRRAHPSVEVSAIEDSTDYLEHLLIGGELDVAISVLSSLKDRDALQTEVLQASPFHLWLTSGHRLARADSVAVHELGDEKLIMLDMEEIEDSTRSLLMAFNARPRVAFRTRSVEAVRSLVATGAGIALLPDLLYRPWSLEGDRIEARDVAGLLPAIEVGIAWRRGIALGPAGREFVRVALGQRTARAR